MRHRASRKFWGFYEKLPADIQQLADKNFQLLKREAIIPRFTSRRLEGFGQRELEFIFAPLQSKTEQTWSGFGLADTMNMNSSLSLEADHFVSPV